MFVINVDKRLYITLPSAAENRLDFDTPDWITLWRAVQAKLMVSSHHLDRPFELVYTCAPSIDFLLLCTPWEISYQYYTPTKPIIIFSIFEGWQCFSHFWKGGKRSIFNGSSIIPYIVIFHWKGQVLIRKIMTLRKYFYDDSC